MNKCINFIPQNVLKKSVLTVSNHLYFPDARKSTAV